MERQRRLRSTATRKYKKSCAPSSTNADSPCVFSDSDSDIDRINEKASDLLGHFLAFSDRNEKNSTASDSRSSSVVPAKRTTDDVVTPTTSFTSNGSESNGDTTSLRHPVDWYSMKSMLSSMPPLLLSQNKPSVVSGSQLEIAKSQAMEKPDTQPATKLMRVKRKMTEREDIPRRSSTPIPKHTEPLRHTQARSSKRNKRSTNYYSTPPGFKSGRKVTKRSTTVCKAPPLPSPSPPRCQAPVRYHHVYYHSATLTVVKEPVGSATEDKRALYHPWEDRIDCDTLWIKQGQASMKPEGVLIHTDLDISEMDAIYYFLSDRRKPESEIIVQDLIVKCVQQTHLTKEGIASLASRLEHLNDFNRLMSNYTSNLTGFFLGYRSGGVIVDIESDIHMVTICTLLKHELNVWAPVHDSNLQAHLEALLRRADEVKLKMLAKDISQASTLKHRSSQELQAFLMDAKSGTLSTSPISLRAYPPQFDQEHIRYDLQSASAHLRSRELGYQLYRARSSINRTLTKSVNGNWQHWKSWKGASHDVVVLGWSPDGTRFAAGAATCCDPRNMMYNRGNNLIIGDLSINGLKELPDHRVPRALIDTSQLSGRNTASEPHLYTSISAVAWSNDGDRMYSSSYDHTVKIWDTRSHCDTKCIGTLRHPGKVHVMALSSLDNHRLATGCDSDSSFRLWQVQENGFVLSSPLEMALRHTKTMTPTSLAWGPTSYTKNLLAAGLSFSDNTTTRGDPPSGGRLALWQLEEAGATELNILPNAQNVFDIAWHPSSPLFAAGIAACGRSRGLGSDIRSMVMIYEPLRSRRDIVSYDCPGLDINDVTFCPFNENYVSASCTDGTTFVWDFRNPDKILHKLPHGPPIGELDPQLTRSQADTGVRLALWGNEPTQFYTGSSDGCVKSWNIMAATEDVFTKDIADLGRNIMSGALSPDKTNMLVGDTSGGIHVLSTSSPSNDDKSMSFQHAEEQKIDDPDSGIRAANELIETGQVVLHSKYGPGKGPNYSGPYAAWARPPDTPADQLSNTRLSLRVQTRQLYGPPVNKRPGLDDATRDHVRAQIWLAKFRNKRSFRDTPPSSQTY
ncbi:WD repeat protein [Arthroderma uncinatum]|uniref:WD repeat protein n=1 Tax=Arthroderma uncinatum TaxID=74035 RepID=UPI00144A53A8|nr:WD repeat protein [Arthroderma uncinatum]KAF3482763.1 WD repeat protein [Arthroderma uncinatum]